MTQSEKTVTVRVPEALWMRIRERALKRREPAGAWLARCAEVCLKVAETGLSEGGVTRSAVEPDPSSETLSERVTQELTYERDDE